MRPQIILPTAIFPNLAYCSFLFNNNDVYIETQEHFIKQSVRNRYVIASPQGALTLSVPLINSGNKTCTGEKLISYQEPWQSKHWRAIESSYRNSPYFEYFEEEIKSVFLSKHEFLVNFNETVLNMVFTILRKKRDIKKTTTYLPFYEYDYRDDLKIDNRITHFPEYYQVVKPTTGFIPNFSILDLLFNEGLFSVNYLLNLKTTD